MEEVIAATAYLDLFIRTATEPSLVRAFVKFVTTEKYDDVSILESLITRIQSNSRVSVMTSPFQLFLVCVQKRTILVWKRIYMLLQV